MELPIKDVDGMHCAVGSSGDANVDVLVSKDGGQINAIKDARIKYVILSIVYVNQEPGDAWVISQGQRVCVHVNKDWTCGSFNGTLKSRHIIPRMSKETQSILHAHLKKQICFPRMTSTRSLVLFFNVLA